MKKFSLKVDVSSMTQLNPDTKKFIEELGSKGCFEKMLEAALQSTHKDGLGGRLQKRHFEILQALDNCDGNFLELENENFEMVKNAFEGEGARFQHGLTRLVMQYRKNIENAE